MSYHDYILKALNEIDMMTKKNEPYVNTKPTQEDVEQIRYLLRGSIEGREAEKKLDRLWQEIERLRSIIEKQIY
jgi:hypothetical protein